MIELTSGQAQLLEKVVKWFKDYQSGNTSTYIHPQWFAYSGASGCGKTTVAHEILKELGLEKGSYIGCAYTGKAVLQMQRNNMSAKTIHSLIYQVIPVSKTDPKTGKKYVAFEFILKEKLDKDYQLIIVDEAPMVNDEIVGELLSFGIPILFMGDMNQLPPVFGISSIMQNPDHVLTQIMRQKEGDPIIQISQFILKGIPIMEGDYGTLKVVRDLDMDRNLLDDYDQILCVTNRMRDNVNMHIRENVLNRPSRNPHLFDKVICRQNNWGIEIDGYYLVNGLCGIITDISRDTLSKGYFTIDFHPDFFPEGVDFLSLHMDSKYIVSPPEKQRLTPRIFNEKFEYAYAITVHLSQGSEYERVLYFDNFFHDKELTKKARYTAITRARTELTVVMPSGSMRL